MYEVFEHTADLGLRVRASSREELFAEAARGLFSLIVANLDQVRAVQSMDFAIAGEQIAESHDDYLLFDWLNELLYAFETQRVVLVEFDVRFNSDGLTATARGEHVDPSRHELDHEVKAITYHGLRVVHEADQWLAEVIVDI